VFVASIDQAQKFDMTSDFSGNIKNYIQVGGSGYYSECICAQDATISQLNVPYFIEGSKHIGKKLTINEGVTVCFGSGGGMTQGSDWVGGNDVLIVNGTAQKPVTFTRLSGGASYYWSGLSFSGNTGCVLNWCTIEYCNGNAITLQPQSTYYDDTKITLNNVTIRDNQSYGVYYDSHHYTDPFNGAEVDLYGTIIHSGVNERFSNNALGNVRLPDGTVSATLP
jgi:hypothetical protein